MRGSGSGVEMTGLGADAGAGAGLDDAMVVSASGRIATPLHPTPPLAPPPPAAARRSFDPMLSDYNPMRLRSGVSAAARPWGQVVENMAAAGVFNKQHSDGRYLLTKDNSRLRIKAVMMMGGRTSRESVDDRLEPNSKALEAGKTLVGYVIEVKPRGDSNGVPLAWMHVPLDAKKHAGYLSRYGINHYGLALSKEELQEGFARGARGHAPSQTVIDITKREAENPPLKKKQIAGYILGAVTLAAPAYLLGRNVGLNLGLIASAAEKESNAASKSLSAAEADMGAALKANAAHKADLLKGLTEDERDLMKQKFKAGDEEINALRKAAKATDTDIKTKGDAEATTATNALNTMQAQQQTGQKAIASGFLFAVAMVASGGLAAILFIGSAASGASALHDRYKVGKAREGIANINTRTSRSRADALSASNAGIHEAVEHVAEDRGEAVGALNRARAFDPTDDGARQQAIAIISPKFGAKLAKEFMGRLGKGTEGTMVDMESAPAPSRSPSPALSDSGTPLLGGAGRSS